MQIVQKKSQLESEKSTITEAKIERLISARLEARRKAFMLQGTEAQDE